MASADSSPWDGILDALTSLASLRNDGLLTAEELAAAQARLLGGGDLQAAGSVPGARREMTAAVLAAFSHHCWTACCKLDLCVNTEVYRQKLRLECTKP